MQNEELDPEYANAINDNGYGDMALDPEYAAAIGVERGTTEHQQTMEILTYVAQAMQKMESLMQMQLQMAEQNLQLTAQTQAAIDRPKRISIGSIQKDAAGNVIGATTSSRLQ